MISVFCDGDLTSEGMIDAISSLIIIFHVRSCYGAGI